MRRRLLLSPLPGEGRAVLEAGPSHYLLRVLRLPRGSELELFDGRGGRRAAQLVDVQAGRAVLELGEALPPPPPLPRLVLLLGLARAPAFDRALRMAVELGVAEVVPLLLERSVARGDRRDRWRRIAAEACRQSGRAELPELHPPLLLEQALTLPGLPELRWLLQPGAEEPPRSAEALALLVGPEGGLTAGERERALLAGFRPAGLGPGVLRVDTAVAAALAALPAR